ncbi:MAG TPA: universal stress protein [Pseudonocardia sp.]|nr:universal stress protein [Pseudonocardia sp.]
MLSEHEWRAPADRGPAPVVVAVDDAGTADGAVEWAAAEAGARGCPLRIVHVARPPVPADPYCAPVPIGAVPTRLAAEAVLADAVGRARTIASDITVSTRLRHGATCRALLDEAARARLLALGGSGPCGPLRALTGALTGEVAVRVAAHASCPIVVVGPAPLPEDDRPPPRVVVGVDAASCGAAVGFAFDAARQRGVPLVAVHAWQPDVPADVGAPPGCLAMAEEQARLILDRALDTWRASSPDVPVHAVLVRDRPGPALAGQSRGAALLVVGSRGRGPLQGAVFGSVSRTVLHRSRGPLAIVPQDRGPAPRSTWSPSV